MISRLPGGGALREAPVEGVYQPGSHVETELPEAEVDASTAADHHR
jgi:hypothetical protein